MFSEIWDDKHDVVYVPVDYAFNCFIYVMKQKKIHGAKKKIHKSDFVL